MQIDGSILRDYIETFCHVSSSKIGNLKFAWADFVSSKDRFDPNTLYVCTGEEYEETAHVLAAQPVLDAPISFLVTSDFVIPEEADDGLKQSGGTAQDGGGRDVGNARVVMECNSSLSPFDLAKSLQDYMRKLTEWKLTMDNEMLCGGMHQEMLDLSEPIFGNTVLVVDCDYSLVAYTKGKAASGGVIQSVIENGRFDDEAMAKLIEAGLVSAGHMPITGKTQRQTWARIDSYEVVAHPFFSRSVFSAFLLMVCDGRKPTRGLECLFGILAEAIGHCVAKDVQQRQRPGSREERFVMSLLEEKLIAGEQLAVSCNERGIPMNGPMRVCHFTVGENCSMGFAEKEIRAAIGQCWLSARGNKIVAICCDEGIVDDAKLMSSRAIRSLLVDNDMYLAVSNVYDDITRTHIAYRQARVAANYRNHEGLKDAKKDKDDQRIIEFWRIAPLWAVTQDEFSDRYLLDCLAQDNSITRLSRDDKPNSVSDVVVLYHYLRSNCDARITSDALYMHRNTVYYRMRRIEEVLDVDLSDPEVRSYLWFLFVLMRSKGVQFS